MKILIITGGKIDDDFALGFLKRESFDHIIVVDGALAFWHKVEMKLQNRVKFDHLVGDFDTISPDILKLYIERTDIGVHRFNPEKDYTDTDIAVKLALELGKMDQTQPPEIYLLGATGSRTDHMLANMQLLVYLKEEGAEGIIVDANNRIRLIAGNFVLQKKELFGHYVSLVPVTMCLKGLTLSGFKYETDRLDVRMGQSRCISNELTAESGQIIIEEGSAFLIESCD